MWVRAVIHLDVGNNCIFDNESMIDVSLHFVTDWQFPRGMRHMSWDPSYGRYHSPSSLFAQISQRCRTFCEYSFFLKKFPLPAKRIYYKTWLLTDWHFGSVLILGFIGRHRVQCASHLSPNPPWNFNRSTIMGGKCNGLSWQSHFCPSR